MNDDFEALIDYKASFAQGSDRAMLIFGDCFYSLTLPQVEYLAEVMDDLANAMKEGRTFIAEGVK